MDRETRDDRRIAELLASEVEGDAFPGLERLAVVNADPDAEGTTEGELAYELAHDDAVVAQVFVHEDRVRVETGTAIDEVAAVADDQGLRVRPQAVRPPKTIVFVESGAQVKRVLPALAATVRE